MPISLTRKTMLTRRMRGRSRLRSREIAFSNVSKTILIVFLINRFKFTLERNADLS